MRQLCRIPCQLDFAIFVNPLRYQHLSKPVRVLYRPLVEFVKSYLQPQTLAISPGFPGLFVFLVGPCRLGKRGVIRLSPPAWRSVLWLRIVRRRCSQSTSAQHSSRCSLGQRRPPHPESANTNRPSTFAQASSTLATSSSVFFLFTYPPHFHPAIISFQAIQIPFCGVDSKIGSLRRPGEIARWLDPTADCGRAAGRCCPSDRPWRCGGQFPHRRRGARLIACSRTSCRCGLAYSWGCL